METVENPRKSRERSKSKSLSENETNANTENESIETAPNLNGDASEESIKDTETDTVQDDPKENENEVEKPEEPSNEAEKPEEPSSEAEKPEEPLNETEKPEEQLNEAEKPEEPLNEEEKPEEPSNEVEKSEEPSNEAEKPEEPSNDDVEKSPQGKKRKASEMQSGDENVNEETVESKDDATATNPTTEPDPNMLIKEEPTDVDMNVDLQMPPKQTLGKGKRARIPNKRYSDIIMSPTAKQKTAAENGDSENDSNTMDVSVKTEPLSPTSSASPLNAAKKQKFSVDLSDPKYLKPFDFGWKRELVLRGIYNADTKINGDVYYVTPNGKKVRSMREVSENLKNKKLSLDNFTFFKKALGVDDPEKEIIRDAKRPMSRAQKMAKSPAMTSPKVLSPKNSTPKTAASRNSGIKRVGLNETADSPPVKTRAAAKGFGNFKVKLPGKKDNNKSTSSTPGEKMEVEATLVKTPNTRKSGKWSRANVPSPTPVTAKKRTIKLSSITNSDEREEHRFMENYLQNLSYGYSTLLYVFQYLKVQDLLRAGCVCTMWRDIANHPMLWRTVRMKNSQVHRFEGLANTLKKHSTRHLDLRKMLLPTGGDEIWPEFSKAIEKVDTLRRIELCRCPATVVEKLAVSNPHLEVINAVTIKCETMDLKPLKSLTSVRELRLKSTGGLTLTSDIDSLKDLTTLKHLSLTSIRDLDSLNLSVIAELTNLESLDLGECTDFPKSFGSDILVKLEKLEKLRLEKGQGDCHTFEILDAVKDMKRLEQLELVNFDIKSGFDKALGACSNIKKLLIIPTYISQSATTNHMVLGGVLRLQKTLSHFVWGVTLELLRVTELFVDQCEEPRDKKEKKQAGNGDSIPVLKPVPLLMDAESEIAPALEPPQVEILALPTLQKLLMQNLPTTRMKILKIPFHATWRQSITDSVN